MLTTADPAGLLATLRTGDVLLFDLTLSHSGLIQWGDRAPTNHAALVLEPDTVVMANAAEPPAAAAIGRYPADELLRHPDFNGVRVVRPGADAQTLRRLQLEVERLEAMAPRFALLDLVALLPAVLTRSYGGLGLPLPAAVAKPISLSLEAAAWYLLRRIPDTAATLTCSEFIYRVLTGAGVDVAIPQPLGESASGRAPLDGAAPAASVVDAVIRHNDATGVWPETDAARRTGTAVVRPDLVTPGDLWRSPSLDAVIQYDRRR